jgi:hypothetical protein
MDRLGVFVLLSNASCAFGLNIAVVFLIGCASSLVLTLSGYEPLSVGLRSLSGLHDTAS